ncbi:MAG TPA: TatD family hydrolase [Dehalococcoidia bacterium]|nr:TatD family hydrolase [Dehalococcoidia bacterium]
MRLIDTHAHIHDREFADDIDAAIERAASAGVETIVTLGTDLDSSRRAIALADRNPHVLAAAGVHPHDAREASDADLDALEAMAAHPKVVLVGEIGLDFYRNLSPRDAQIRVIERQLATARRVGKPIAVHTREAQDDMLAVLTSYSRDMGARLPDGRPLGVMHYFSGDVEAAQRFIELGFLISVHTSVTHPKAEMLRGVAREVPLERLVVETDSPYGAPQAYRGKRNEPAYVLEAARAIAGTKGMSVEAVAATTTANASNLLGVALVATGPSAAAGRD